MSAEIQFIGRALNSASHITLENGDFVLLIEQNGRLIEKVYDGDELKDQRMVVRGVKEGATAGYAISNDRIQALYFDSDGSIKASEFDPDSEEWDDGELEGLDDVGVHPQSNLTIAGLPGSNFVIYQASDGSIETQGKALESECWSEKFTVPGAAALGTPIAGFSTDKAFVVSFIGDDNMIHAHSRDFDSGDWTEETLPSSSFDEEVKNLIVAQDTGELEAYVLAGTTIYHVRKDGKQETIATLGADGDFVPTGNAEAYGINYGNYYRYPDSDGYGGTSHGYSLLPCPTQQTPSWPNYPSY
ncbi:hypothetical protein FBEOM_14419 [Fusarium beomiforme]|uniref:Fucose-specific lectin n=1 Tax=Fusarium beomiforme TaxID=44412 RepID=A0A9P5DQ81_9HYPO|nr:hypothetical protein FBEOM_14419 [Fusarium beomiforme]